MTGLKPGDLIWKDKLRSKREIKFSFFFLSPQILIYDCNSIVHI